MADNTNDAQARQQPPSRVPQSWKESEKESENVGKVLTGLSMSLDSFIAGPNDGPERILGDGGERILAW